MTVPKPATIREAYLQASSFLAAAGVRDSSSNAELLLRHLLDWDRTAFLLCLGDPFPAGRSAEWERLLQRKAEGEPVQYMIGEQEFYGLPFAVGPSVLIPRPETELLVEAVVEAGRRKWPAGAPVLADVGTGSGAIAVTIAHLCPAWHIHATDLSAKALDTALRNAERHGSAGRIKWHRGDLLEPLIDSGIRPDILVSNPPYIPSADIAGLQPEVRAYEPLNALDGGEDGLDPYQRMTVQLERLPAYPALIGFEVGTGQAGVVAGLLERTGRYGPIRIIRDLAGIERHVIAEQ